MVWAGILGVVLMACFLFGLIAASRAVDDGTYAAGFILAGASLLGLGWDLRYGFAGALPGLLVETAEGLAVLVALLAALALGGLVLAARAQDTSLHSIGYALCVVCIVLIAWNLKHYCDVRDRAPPL